MLDALHINGPLNLAPIFPRIGGAISTAGRVFWPERR